MKKNDMSYVSVTRTAVLLAGPVASITALRHIGQNLMPGEMPLAALVILAIWSPLFFSIPALMMGEVRDAYRTNSRGPIASTSRAVTLVPALLMIPGRTRIEMTASLFGFAAGLIASSPIVAQLPSLI